MKKLLFMCIVFWAIGCSSDSQKKNSNFEPEELRSEIDGISNLFEIMPTSQTNITFENAIRDSLQMLCFSYEYAFNGGGVAVGDINNDGLQDLFFTGTLVANRLYLNEGNFKFRDITDAAGVNNGMGTNIGTSMIDINGDGLLDIYVCKSGTINNANARKNCMYINQGNLTFVDEAAKYGLDDPSYNTQAYFADYDLDGDLDVYCVNHPINWGQESNLNLQVENDGTYTVIKDTQRLHVTDRYLVNEGGKFVDNTFGSEVDNAAFGLSGIVNDFNDDGYPDIYICNDYSKPDRLMINQKGKGFKDEILTYFDNISASSMGSDLVDLNNDGEMDFFVNDMMHEDITTIKQQQSYLNYDLALIGRQYGYHDQFKYNSMQIKAEDGLFSNIGFMTNTDKSGWSWAVLGADYDHNGHNDLFICNGYLKDVTNMDYSKFKLDSLRRTSKGMQVGKLYDIWSKIVDSLYTPNMFYANMGEYNFVNASRAWNAGPNSFSNGAAYADLDNDGDLDLIVNNINDPAFIMKNTIVEKKGVKSLRIKDLPFNTKVQAVFNDGSKIATYYYPIRGFVSSVEPYAHIAIPKDKSIDYLIITWPGGAQEKFDVNGKSGEITLAKGTGGVLDKQSNQSAAFSSIPTNLPHKENQYIDFKREPLLHMKHSVLGPAIAVDQKNNHVAISGSFQNPSMVVKYDSQGGKLSSAMDLPNSESYEDVDIEFGDVNGDGINDIVCLGGGYQWTDNSKEYGLRVYLAKKDGTYQMKPIDASLKVNANAMALADFDKDGDVDIIVGGGAKPGSYPFSNKSYVLWNDKGNFSIGDLPEDGQFGIIKDLEAADINNDGNIDVIMASEWGPIKTLTYVNNQWNTNIVLLNDNLKGMWQEIELLDIDNDGDLDICAGNLGENSFFKASKDKPTCIYASDFDGNGENDPILCTYFGNKSYPVHSRDEILDQMTTLRKKYLRYGTYANHDIVDMFGKEKVENATVFIAEDMSNAVWINDNGVFNKKVLPKSAQFSMGNGFAMIDVNRDGKKELIVVGNYHDTDYDFGKYDASIGAILSFTDQNRIITYPNNGFYANKNARTVDVLDANTVLVGNNDGPLQVFRLRN